MPLLYPLFIGIIAAIIDTAPMILRKMDAYSIVSAFLFHLTAPLILSRMQIPLAPWLRGMAVYAVLVLPILVIVAKAEKKAVPIIALNTLVIGGLAGWALSLR